MDEVINSDTVMSHVLASMIKERKRVGQMLEFFEEEGVSGRLVETLTKGIASNIILWLPNVFEEGVKIKRMKQLSAAKQTPKPS